MNERSELLPIKTLASVVFSYMFGKKFDDKNDKLMKVLQRADWFNQMYEATCSFCCLIKENDHMNLIRWMKKYWKTNITQLKAFIRGVKLDYKAVNNTIINTTYGITEGFVNKLKVVKRIMYGKASIELLKNKLTMEHVLFN